MDKDKLVFFAIFFAVLGVLSFIGIFVRRALLKPLNVALGDGYHKDRTYAGVFNAIALDGHALRFAWTGPEGPIIIGANEVVGISCEDGTLGKSAGYTELKILTNRDDVNEDISLVSFFRQDKLKEIAARLTAMKDKAKANNAAMAVAVPVAASKALTENERLTNSIERLTAAVTRLTTLMGRVPPPSGRRRPIRRK
jgi:hypothetical protein